MLIPAESLKMTVFSILIEREYQNEYKWQFLDHHKFLDKSYSIFKNPIVLHRFPFVFIYYDVTAGGKMAPLTQIFAYGPNLWLYLFCENFMPIGQVVAEKK